jgi:diacylglycerol kinase family enzyme
MRKKIVTLFHNPTAGNGNHEKQNLIRLIKKGGYDCRYRSVKSKRWKKIPEDTDYIAIAGGDGTVKKCIRLLSTTPYLNRKWEIGLLPVGTANNIALSLGISGKLKNLITGWGKKTTGFHTGHVTWGKKEAIFGEGVGIGIFPVHIKQMTGAANERYILADRLQIGSIDLLRSVGFFTPLKCEIEIDGRQYDGDYLAVEIMNIRAIGPNIVLAPDAETGDGYFDVVLVSETERRMLSDYLYAKLVKETARYPAQPVRAKQVRIKVLHNLLHIDDELKEQEEPLEVSIKNHSDHLSFFI